METLELIDSLEDLIESGVPIPLAGKCLLDKDELLDLVQEIRMKIPEDFKQAKWIKEERQRILLDAQKEANTIVKTAEDKIISMINENEITKQANEKASEIMNSATKRSKEIKNGTRQYVEDILVDVERILEKTIGTLRDNRIAMQQKDARRQVQEEHMFAANNED